MTERCVSSPAKIDINLTPMIDVVFQLLTFFLMTFKVASPEGDFQLLLPAAGRSLGPQESLRETIVIRLASNVQGDLASLQIDSQPPLVGREAFGLLHRHIVKQVNLAREAGQDEPEIHIDADDLLRYENVIHVVTAVSGRIDESGRVDPLVKRIRFARP